MKFINENMNILRAYFKQYIPRNKQSDFSIDYEDLTLKKTGMDYASQLAKGYFNTIVTKQQLMQEVDRFKNHYIVQTINDVIIDDGFNQVGGDVCRIVYNSPDLDQTLVNTVQKEIDKFVENFEIQKIIEDVLEEFVMYSEYFLRIVGEPRKGIVEIADDVDIDRIVGVYQMREKKYFVEFDGRNVKQRDADNYIHFLYSPRKIKIRLKDYQEETIVSPSYIKVGRPYIYGIAQKLKELEVLEAADIASNLKKILAPILVMLGVPANTPPKNAAQATKLYEEKLNSLHKDVEQINQYTMSEILSLANKIAVLPNFGDGKGSIETIDIRKEEGETSDKIDRIKNNIANTEGIPPFYLGVTGETGLNKMDTLKIYSRYTRKLVKYQNSTADAIRDLVYKHLYFKGIYVRKENIAVEFKSLPNVDLLDDIEHMVGLSTAIQSIFQTFSDISVSDQVKVRIDSERLVEFLDQYLGAYPAMSGIMTLEEIEEGEGGFEGGEEFGMGGLGGEEFGGGFEETPTAEVTAGGGGEEFMPPGEATPPPPPPPTPEGE